MLSTQKKVINRHQWISEAAYFLAEAKSFKIDKTLDNWLEAELAYSEMMIATYLARQKEDNEPINIVGLQQLAASLGIENPEKLISKAKLIHAIQDSMKHRPCFRELDINLCQELECQWKSECRKLTAAWSVE